MPRVHFVKKARKDNPAVKAGESYYWWKFRYGGKRYSATPPKGSQLTQSAYYSQIRALCESIEETDVDDQDSFDGLKDDIGSELEMLRDECQEKLDNMAQYNLEYSPTGEMLQERIDACENAQMEFDSIEEWNEDDPLEHEFEEACPECDGSGEDQSEDAEDDDICQECDGSGEYFNENEYQAAVSDFEERQHEWAQNAKSELIDAVSSAEV